MNLQVCNKNEIVVKVMHVIFAVYIHFLIKSHLFPCETYGKVAKFDDFFPS